MHFVTVILEYMKIYELPLLNLLVNPDPPLKLIIKLLEEQKNEYSVALCSLFSFS